MSDGNIISFKVFVDAKGRLMTEYSKLPSSKVTNVFDDYDKPKWPGCIKAVNEFFRDRTKDILTYKVPSGLGSDKDKTNLHYIRHYLIKK